MADRYQSGGKKSSCKFEVLRAKQLATHFPGVKVWEESIATDMLAIKVLQVKTPCASSGRRTNHIGL